MSEETQAPYEPFSGSSPIDEAQKHQQEKRRALIIAYRATFSSGAGRLVLADLHRRFQFTRWPAEDTEDERKITRRVFMHGPLYYIEDMRLAIPSQPKRKRTTNETTTDNLPTA